MNRFDKQTGLKPCPFCGGEAEIIDLEEGENAGGSCVTCTRCQASGNVEFGRKENFISNWNRRAEDPAIANLRERIDEVVEFNGCGFWRTCTGCYESEDGYPNGDYPRSAVLQCTLGAGCSECGGIGATWDDIDYDDMAREILAEEGADSTS